MLDRNCIKPYLLILSSFVFLGLFTYLPVIKTLFYSFFRWYFYTLYEVFTGFATYPEVFRNPLAWKVLANTFLFAAETIIPSIALGMFLAVLLNPALRGISFLRLSVYYPSVLPTVALGAIWVLLFIPSNGIVPYYLGKLGIPNVRFLEDPRLVLQLLVYCIQYNFAFRHLT